MINKQTEFLKGRQHTPQLSVFKRPLIRGINNATKNCFPSMKHFHNVVSITQHRIEDPISECLLLNR